MRCADEPAGIREHVLRDAWHRVDDFFDKYLRTPAPSAAAAKSLGATKPN